MTADRSCDAVATAGSTRLNFAISRRGFLQLASVPILTGPWLPSIADLPSVIARVKTSIAIVGTYSEVASPRFTLRGTGFVVGKGNWAITNAHVLPELDTGVLSQLVVLIRDTNGGLVRRLAKVLEIDSGHDIALLVFEGAPVPALMVKNSDEVLEGQSVGLMGFPIGGALGFSPVTHRGMISSITNLALPQANSQQINARAARSLREGEVQVFQLDATAYPGNSGGPLFELETGDVIGVVNSVYVKGSRETALTHPSGITYAIPSKYVQNIIKNRN